MESRLWRAGAFLPHPDCCETGSSDRYPVEQIRAPCSNLLQHLLQHQDTRPFDTASNGGDFGMPDDIADVSFIANPVISIPLPRTNQ